MLLLLEKTQFFGPLLSLNLAKYRVLGHSCVSMLGNSLDDTVWHNTILHLLEGQEDERALTVIGGSCKYKDVISFSRAVYSGAWGWGEEENKFHNGAQTAGKILLACAKSLLNSNKQLSKLLQAL